MRVISFRQGNLFDSQAEALVNAVNCVGVMGKGIALQFKRAYPAMYAARCRRGEVRLGEMTFFREAGKTIINFPTKDHWKSSSRLEDVVTGLGALRELIVREHIRTIALPALGCGYGGLDWLPVKTALLQALDGLADVDIEVYEPMGQAEAGK